MEEARPVRSCDVCGIEDTDPRHVANLDDGTIVTRHMDCCKTVGCPDGSCEVVTAGVEDLRGDELVAHLTGSE